MAYNSDGYIMIDFAEVDFRRTNQTIDGLFDRCQKVIGTNKFVLVINANNKTPLPSTVSITNGQYVIESCIYSFSISSNDNLFIKRNDPTIDELKELKDVNIVNAENGDVLTFDSTSNKWVNEEPAAVIDELSELTDVNISNVSDGDVLTFDSTSNKWVNAEPGQSGIDSHISNTTGTLKATNFVDNTIDTFTGLNGRYLIICGISCDSILSSKYLQAFIKVNGNIVAIQSGSTTNSSSSARMGQNLMYIGDFIPTDSITFITQGTTGSTNYHANCGYIKLF